ncbi:ribosomal oxygenase 1-like [Stegodyphus dumicola]|uniref:ribosomal oxygenase 1-like n=1 Tax=Stegodyphus dumicola TaxID=202533 RepID=UPI0015B11DA1|nr:ribosomal oxygenase 1-like [Stegodyphus dumicola]
MVSSTPLTFISSFRTPQQSLHSLESYGSLFIISQVFERKPVHIAKRNESPDYFKTVMSCKHFDNMMRENFLEYSKHIDVVIYTDGVRKTFNPEGRAYPSSVWKFYREGCSVRMQNPQSYHDNLWKLCSNLQEYFGSYVGANLYLTPPGSQGFAPHYDDIDAFILQLEGRKLWKIYPPRTNKEVLPRTSSVNFTQDEIGTPIMECELLPGDLLYFPRGFIHQARTADDVHSLHVTISTNQKNTFGDLLELALPRALEQAIKEDPEFRESLPKDYMNLVGTTNSNIESPERNKFLEKVISLSSKILKYLSVDEAADQHAKDFIHASMPPHLTLREKSRSIYGHGEEWENGRIVNVTELSPDSKIRLIRKRAARLVAGRQASANIP